VADLSYFLHRSVHPEVSIPHHATLLAHYHRSHTEAVEAFGMHGFELELETLLKEYRAKKELGAFTGCLIRVAIYVLQCLSIREQQQTATLNNDAKNGRRKRENGEGIEEEEEEEEEEEATSICTEKLRVARDLVPVDLRLRPHLAPLAAICPCPCSIGGGSREVDVAELPADNLEEDIKRLHQNQKYLHYKDGNPGFSSSGGGLKSLDCSNGGTTGAIKKLFTGLIRSNEDKAAAAAAAAAAKDSALAAAGASAAPINKAENGREQ